MYTYNRVRALARAVLYNVIVFKTSVLVMGKVLLLLGAL